ncbi:MAG: hypothetical protein EBY41_07180 [Proteobacteria bacterium]|nr:hypothetical protein [Pseudomonadota bacterium]
MLLESSNLSGDIQHRVFSFSIRKLSIFKKFSMILLASAWVRSSSFVNEAGEIFFDKDSNRRKPAN